MRIVPINDRIVVQRVDAETKSPGGIVLPSNAQEKPTEAIVLAVGPGKLLEDGTRAAPQVKAGDRVLFSKYSGAEFKKNAEEILVLREDDVLGVVVP